MIGYLEGTVRVKRPGVLVVMAGSSGIGHVVHVTQPIYVAYGLGDRVELLVETKVSETDITLFGFETEEEQDLFCTLCKVQKIGGKLALEFLGALGHEGFCQAITEKDEKRLKAVKGVGAAMAQRLLADSGIQKFVKANYTPNPKAGQNSGVFTLVMNSMKALGYAPAEMDDLVRKTIDELGAEIGAPRLISEVLKRKQAQAA
jgi:holliday junction DNA helicase RuvA